MVEYIEREAPTKYYVVRDKNTGLYFRGKGVNRWGKYYNQASIYRIKANAENAIKEVSWRGEQAEVVEIRIIETTADVVEVVRCKDCEYCDKSCGYGLQCRHPDGLNSFVCETEYCSYGIAKMDGKGE